MGGADYQPPSAAWWCNKPSTHQRALLPLTHVCQGPRNLCWLLGPADNKLQLQNKGYQYQGVKILFEVANSTHQPQQAGGLTRQADQSPLPLLCFCQGPGNASKESVKGLACACALWHPDNIPGVSQCPCLLHIYRQQHGGAF